MTFFTCHPGRWLTTLYFEQIIKPAAKLGEPDADSCEQATKFAHQQLGIVENWFEHKQWLANDAFSIADTFALAYVEQARAIGFALDEHPRVKAWFERLETRDSTARARARVQPYVQAMMS